LSDARIRVLSSETTILRRVEVGSLSPGGGSG
jgi:hypothetical protein